MVVSSESEEHEKEEAITLNFLFSADQLPVRPSSGGPERRNAARSEGEDQTVGQQHHPHLPRLLLALPHLPAGAHAAGAGLQLHSRYGFIQRKRH